jgi:hypothetical protein
MAMVVPLVKGLWVLDEVAFERPVSQGRGDIWGG